MSARHYSSANRVQSDAAILDGLSAKRSYPETGLGGNNGDLPEEDFWPDILSEFVTTRFYCYPILHRPVWRTQWNFPNSTRYRRPHVTHLCDSCHSVTGRVSPMI